MRRAADSREGGDLAEAQSALDRLQEARRLLDRGRTERLDRDVQDALRRAERLGQQQEQMTSDVERLGADGGPPSAEAMARIMERKDELQSEVSELEGDLDRMAREWRDEQRAAAQELGEAAQSIRDNRLADKIRYSKGVVQQRTPEYARNFEEQIGADIEELRQRIERAAGAVGEGEGQRVEELLEDTRDLVQGLESLDERIRSQAERLQRGGEQGQQGEQQQGGQQQGGQQQGGQQQGGQQQGRQQGGGQGQQEGRQAGRPGDGGGNPTGATRGGFGGFDPGDVRQYRREFRERLGELEELRQGLAQEGIDVDPLSDAMERLRQLDSRGIFDDPAEIARLQGDVIDGLKEFEYVLRRAFQSEDADRLLLSGSDEVPEGFRELVEEYYRSLSNRNR
jgi:hypothetical protein